MLAEERAVLTATCAAIRVLHELGLPYADDFSPLHEGGIAIAMRHLHVLARGEPLGCQDLEAVSPPVFGRYLLLYSTDVDGPRRTFAIRHGLGHVAAGHVAEISFLSSRDDHMAYEERVADLFALADLVPGWQLEAFASDRASWSAVRGDVAKRVRDYTLNWPEDRVDDRAALRVLLYREHGL